MLSFPILLSTFALIFVAELPDKTALAALVLGSRYKASHVIFGTWLALVVQTLIAVLAGSILTLLPEEPVKIAAGIGFIVFGYLAIRRKEDEAEETEEDEVRLMGKKQRPAWLTSFLVVFIAEWGDLTQLATAALVAHEGHALSVAIGATAALWAVSLIAIIAGSQLSRVMNPKKITLLSGVLFGIVGVGMILSALL